jgi:DNA-binding IclR family transcriptional regulator
MTTENSGQGVVQRAFNVIRLMADAPPEGMRVTHIAKLAGLTQGTVHRTLQTLIDQQIVEQDIKTKHYRLSIDFFSLAARASHPSNFRDQCRPTLIRLSISLGDTTFLLVRSGLDAICLDRSEGPLPIRSFTGDIGGRIALGVGQGSLAILSFLPEAEREEILRINLPRLRELNVFDEVYLRTAIDRVRILGYAAQSNGLIEGMAGVAVPVFDSTGRCVAALSVGTLAERLNQDRLPTVVELLKKESKLLSEHINPFDPTLRRPIQNFAAVNPGIR